MKTKIIIFSICIAQCFGIHLASAQSSAKNQTAQKLKANQRLVNFGEARSNDVSERIVEVTNTSENDLHLTEVSFELENALFSIAGYPSIVSAGEVFALRIYFSPASSGTFGNTLKVHSEGYEKPLYIFLHGTATGENRDADKLLFPNPVDDLLNLIYQPEGDATIDVFDVSGNKEISQCFDKYINVARLKTGLYQLVITERNKVHRIHFIKR